MEVTSKNFKDLLDEIRTDIDEATFFAIDGEFTGIPRGSTCASPYDSPAQFYDKTLKNTDGYIMIQVGLSVFKYDPAANKFRYKSYNFYVCPKNFSQTFVCSGETVSFLSSIGFDFNKLFRDGIRCCSNVEAVIKREYLDKRRSQREQFYTTESEKVQSNQQVTIPADDIDYMNRIFKIIDNFLDSDEPERVIEKVSAYQRKLIFELCEAKYGDRVTVTTRNVSGGYKQMVIERKKDAAQIERFLADKLEDDKREYEDYIGMSLVIQLISKSKKLLVGHNMFLDILYMYRQFFETLPETLKKFKTDFHKTFPHVIDTKYICESKEHKSIVMSSNLADLFTQLGKKPFELPVIEAESEEFSYSTESPKDHEAGYDSYVTGVCFLGLMQLLKVKSNEINERAIQLKPYLNKICVMRLSNILHINLTGKEPIPNRNHIFYIEFPRDWQPTHINSKFKQYGGVFISWINDTSAYVSLFNRQHSDTVLKTIGYTSGFKILKFSDHYRSNDDSDDERVNKKRKCENDDQDAGSSDPKKRSRTNDGKIVKSFKENNDWT